MYNDVLNELMNLKDDKKIEVLSGYFKTGKGEYGEGDAFLGISGTDQRKIAKKYYKNIDLSDIKKLLQNKYNEVRQTSLFILVNKMLKTNIKEQEDIIKLYLDNTKYINNWNLVDCSAHYVLGKYLYDNNINRDILYILSKSNSLWEQRISIMATFYFIKNNDYKDTIDIATILLNHKHDLIHKAVGWMLREVGNRDYKVEYDFLKEHYHNMPRTMLRYAIEKFDEDVRKKFINGSI
jgi:3-methyladenine DNA glycosylase AlkD